jgi:uncharacterized membrane protein YgdD (TMEM256/DUF423 family)
MDQMKRAAVGAFSLALAIMLAAFGAHGLEGKVTPERLETWATGGQYHLLISVVLLFLGWLSYDRPKLTKPFWVMFAGMCVFSGSLYALVLSDIGVFGAITPIGGVLMIAASIWCGLVLFKDRS